MPRSETQPRRGNTLKREDILEVAVDAFSQKGYRGTNLEDVAVLLGITRQAIYYHYRNKHALLLEMFEEFFDRIDAAVEEASQKDADSVKRFENMVRAHVLTITDVPALSAIFTREFEALEPESREMIRRRRRSYQRLFMEAYKVMADSGAARPLPEREVVSLIFGAANWTFRWYDRRRSSLNPDELTDLLLDLFRSGYLTRGRRR